jgi:hypothetical protein
VIPDVGYLLAIADDARAADVRADVAWYRGLLGRAKGFALLAWLTS